MIKKYIVKLTREEKQYLKSIISSGKHAAKKILKARILLKANEGWTDAKIAEAFDVTIRTLERMRQQFVEEGLENFLQGRYKNRQYHRKLDGKQEAQLTALACSKAPEGRSRWTLQLLADRMVELQYVDSLSYQTVRNILKKTN